MSGVYKCKLRRRIPRPQSPAPSKEVIEIESNKETPVTMEESAPITEEVNVNPNTKSIEVSIKPGIKQEPLKHSVFHVFNSESPHHTTNRAVHTNPLLRKPF